MPRTWTVADSLETYGVKNWGRGYFSANDKGELIVTPSKNENDKVNLPELVDEVRRRGIALPLLIRFSDILRVRITELNEAFRNAIQEYGYKNAYKGVYPIKVNQDRYVVEEIVQFGRPYNYGLEAGSKPELLAVLAMLTDEEALIVCNGYKDEEYVETALIGSKLGRTVILVVEKPSELALIAQVAKRVGVKPRIGVRAKLSARGSGKWEASGGDRSKFGLSSHEMMEMLKFLRENNMLDCLELMHFHLGSQISAIKSVKTALREAVRFYVELFRQGANLKYLDVGGGLGIDYDGSQTNFSSSINYTMQEYANDIVYGVMDVCDQAQVPHPILVSESGRAVVAHSSMLVLDVLGVSEFDDVGKLPDHMSKEDNALVIVKMFATFRDTTRKNLLESYHDALEYKDECVNLFTLGHLSLQDRVLTENLFWATCMKILRFVREMDEVPEELESLERTLSDTYFVNFSMFQSLPDSWAVDQLFPIVPIHRLNEEPTRRAVLADITCDSDGKIDQFIDKRDVKAVLELHPFKSADYLLGIFLVGAYQEILGDLHNLFGDTNTVHVSLGPDSTYHIDHVVAGDTVTDVLQYVSYTRDGLIARARQAVEQALRTKKLTFEESRDFLRLYEQGLSGYTYLERE
ncbi:MAG: biosynthetic arginine decarboxylase [Deltaproteobacteria bacterium]|nr:biosynthetic arginine decarboxylase [Deltaproteobacteria bacterium]